MLHLNGYDKRHKISHIHSENIACVMKVVLFQEGQKIMTVNFNVNPKSADFTASSLKMHK